jgi:hypothetical protein
MAHVIRSIALLALLAAVTGSSRAAEPSIEYAVKASYLYKFAPFVQWPATAFATPSAPLTICIVGQDPFGHMLEDAVRGQRVNGHPFEVRRVDTVRAGMLCHILYAGAAATEALQAVANAPVLTVTDGGQAGSSGGIIQFVTVQGHVRFAINQAAAAGNGIEISSKLLGLAVKVTR